jgi:hypothetical protein
MQRDPSVWHKAGYISEPVEIVEFWRLSEGKMGSGHNLRVEHWMRRTFWWVPRCGLGHLPLPEDPSKLCDIIYHSDICEKTEYSKLSIEALLRT